MKESINKKEKRAERSIENGIFTAQAMQSVRDFVNYYIGREKNGRKKLNECSCRSTIDKIVNGKNKDIKLSILLRFESVTGYSIVDILYFGREHDLKLKQCTKCKQNAKHIVDLAREIDKNAKC